MIRHGYTLLNNSGEADVERPRNLVRHRERDVLFAALDGPHIAAVEAALVRERFLGKSLLPAQFGDTFPEFLWTSCIHGIVRVCSPANLPSIGGLSIGEIYLGA
jgi:hypothetical protein